MTLFNILNVRRRYFGRVILIMMKQYKRIGRDKITLQNICISNHKVLKFYFNFRKLQDSTYLSLYIKKLNIVQVSLFIVIILSR